jgi:peptidoglycan hydrolase-like protein with peptidoglycan-binding domain
MRNLMLITASVIALGIGGAGITRGANMGDASGANPPAVSGMPRSSQTAADLANDDIRQSQWELRAQGLYKGPIDGALNERTEQAVREYQKQNGLNQTASLDQATMRSLREHTGIAGSSAPPSGADRATGLMTNPHPELLGESRPGGSTAPY